MKKQRDGHSRRNFLLATGAAGFATVAGCIGGSNSGDGGDGSGGGKSMRIAILSAGSLNNALLSDFKAAVDVSVRIESHGSADVARLIDEGVRDPDIVALADTALFNKLLTPPWYSVFTSNAVVIAINDTKQGQRVAKAGKDSWYKPIVNGAVKLGRTPPDQDPLGYRTLFMLDLASQYYADAKNLRETIPKRDKFTPKRACSAGSRLVRSTQPSFTAIWPSSGAMSISIFRTKLTSAAPSTSKSGIPQHPIPHPTARR